jgi:PhnB protein
MLRSVTRRRSEGDGDAAIEEPDDPSVLRQFWLAPGGVRYRGGKGSTRRRVVRRQNDNSRKECTMQVQPYLFFEGRCQEAIDFYRHALGAEVLMKMTYADSPVPTDQPPEARDKLMHASVRIGETEVFMSDGRCGGAPAFQGFALSIALSEEAEAARVFAALADGGTVSMPLGKTFFATAFGMLNDRFGVSWMVMVQG